MWTTLRFAPTVFFEGREHDPVFTAVGNSYDPPLRVDHISTAPATAVFLERREEDRTLNSGEEFT